jgi:phosphatidate phosphatase APP1
MSLYPELPFLLIGDSGQHDPEIYAEVVERFPGRVPTVYIRDVSPDRRDSEIRLLAEKVREQKGELLLVRHSEEAALHAISRGFMALEQEPAIRAEAEPGTL